MTPNANCCPICGTEYGFVDRVSQPEMCAACCKAGNKLPPRADAPSPKMAKKCVYCNHVNEASSPPIQRRVLWQRRCRMMLL